MTKYFYLVAIFLLMPSFSWSQNQQNEPAYVLTPEHITFVISSDFSRITPARQKVKVACTNTILSFQGADDCQYVCVLDCANTRFTWQFIAEKDWLQISPDDINWIQGFGYVTFSVNATRLQAYPPENCDGKPCYRSALRIYTQYDLNNCIKYCGNQTQATTVIRAETKDYPDFVTVYLSYNEPFNVSPDTLNFVGFMSNQGISWLQNPLNLKVRAGFHDWLFWTDVDWLQLEKEGTDTLKVQIINNFSSTGNYEGHIFLKDNKTGEIKTVNVEVTITSDLVVTPTSVGFVGVLSDGEILGLSPKTIMVLPSENWSFQVQGDWFSVQKTATGLLITPVADILKINGPGVYRGTVTITFGPTNTQETVNLVAEIRFPLSASSQEILFTGHYVYEGSSNNATLVWDKTAQQISLSGTTNSSRVANDATWIEALLQGDTLSLQINDNSTWVNGQYLSWVKVFDPNTGERKYIKVKARVKDKGNFKNIVYHVRIPLDQGFWGSDELNAFSGQIFEGRFILSPIVSEDHLYVEGRHSALPGYAFAYNRSLNQFVVAVKNGVPVPYIDDLFYSNGDVSEIDIGPFPLFYLAGDIKLILKKGPSWSQAEPFFESTIHVHSLNGAWLVSDVYCDTSCEEYQHPYPLKISESFGKIEISWGDYHPTITYNVPSLYQIAFQKSGLVLEYNIQDIDDTGLHGYWFYYEGEDKYGPFPFSAFPVNSGFIPLSP